MKRFEIIFKRLLPYLLCFGALFALMFFGSRKLEASSVSPLSNFFDRSDFTITADQISESYTVANIASAVSLPSSDLISANYVTINSIYASSGLADAGATAVLDKPAVVDTSNLSRGILTHVVASGETLDTIANTYHVDKNRLRWSNNLKSDALELGKTLLVPSVNGIIYKVKDGDNIDAIASKYQSNKEEIIARNDLEKNNIQPGQLLLLPGGSLPERERPEYTPRNFYAAPAPRNFYSARRFFGDFGKRRNMSEVGSYAYWNNVYYSTRWQGNPGAWGNCTWFAWYWRRNHMPSNFHLPSRVLGNASVWHATLGEFRMGNIPAYGAVMQSSGGPFGHVAVITSVNPGVSVVLQEMNWSGPNGSFNHVYESTMSWSDALKYNYIYERRY